MLSGDVKRRTATTGFTTSCVDESRRSAQLSELFASQVSAEQPQTTIGRCDQPVGVDMVQCLFQAALDLIDFLYVAPGDGDDAEQDGGVSVVFEQFQVIVSVRILNGNRIDCSIVHCVRELKVCLRIRFQVPIPAFGKRLGIFCPERKAWNSQCRAGCRLAAARWRLRFCPPNARATVDLSGSDDPCALSSF